LSILKSKKDADLSLKLDGEIDGSLRSDDIDIVEVQKLQQR